MENSNTATQVMTANTSATPELRDTDITPGCILDLDGDGRLDTKEMSLYQLGQLQHGDVKANRQSTYAGAAMLTLPEQLPSNKIPAFPSAPHFSGNDVYVPKYENDQ